MPLFGRVALLLLSLSSLLFAQAEGEVESLGFGGYYRPDCWVPLLVRLHPTTDAPVSLQIRVYQKDLDNDRVAAVRQISLTPAVEGRSSDQSFWMYFRPQPEGLPDATRGDTLKTLAEQLKVVLCDKDGQAIANLPLTQMARRADLDAAGNLTGVRVVLCVSEAAHQPTWREYEDVTGLAEKPLFLVTRLKDLPEDVRGYEMVDAVVWLGAPAPDPRKGTEEPRFRALEQFVRQGHMLVVCQGSETSLTRGFESLLPVSDISGREDASLEPLSRLMRLIQPADAGVQACAFAKARSQARVELEKVWRTPAGEERSPYLARLPLGLGCVTWVAQDLSEPSLARRLPQGWPLAWDTVLAWRNDPQPPPRADSRRNLAVQPYGTLGERGDALARVGAALLRGGSMTLTVSGYVLVAVGFFGIYWIVAGPGASAFLTMRKLAHLNWFVFGALAVGAAGLSLGVTRLVQSRSVRLDHVTLVKLAPDMPALVESRIGLYVPRDGAERVELKDTQPRTVNWITPYPLYPDPNRAPAKFLASKEYDVPIEDAASSTGAAIAVPYRSTQKRLDARWCGTLAARIEGKVTFANGNNPELYGVLTNSTGHDLQDIYFVYTGPSLYGGRDADRVLYVPQWPAGKTLELSQAFDRGKARIIGHEGQNAGEPGENHVVEGLIEPVHKMPLQLRAREGWVSYWYGQSGAEGSRGFDRVPLDDSGSHYRFSLPFLSLAERIPPMRNQQDSNGDFRMTRCDFARLNARSFDASSAVAAGQLLILAQAEGALPYPLEVQGQRVAGQGVVFYQVVLPLDRK